MNRNFSIAYECALNALKNAGMDGITPRQYAKKLHQNDCVHAMKALSAIHKLYRERIKTEWKAVIGNPCCAQECFYKYSEPSEEMLK